MEIKVPDFCLMIILGPENAGQQYIKASLPPMQFLGLGECRQLMGIQPAEAPKDTFELLLQLAGLRLKYRQSVCLDGTSLAKAELAQVMRLARKYHCRPVAISIELPLSECQELNAAAAQPQAGNILRLQHQLHLDQAPHLRDTGFRQVIRLQNRMELEQIRFQTNPLPSDQRHQKGPFDFVGDIHGCLEELMALLDKLAYSFVIDQNGKRKWQHPNQRRLAFVGDFCDRGPDTPGVYEVVMELCSQGLAIAVPGNHDDKLKRKLSGREVSLKHGLAETMQQLEGRPEDFKSAIKEFIHQLPYHQLLEDGKYLIAHAGLKEEMHNRSSGEVQSFCLYGDTTGETDEFGLPVRLNWAANYEADTIVVYGHTPVPEAIWQNNTINIDTGCVFGGKLTALRMPERELVQVKAQKMYAKPSRPIQFVDQVEANTPSSSALEWVDPRIVTTTEAGYALNLDEQQSRNLLAHLHYNTVDPRWLRSFPLPLLPPPYLPKDQLLESPVSAMNQLLECGVEKVIAKRLESPVRGVLVVCKDEQAAKEYFGANMQGLGTLFDSAGKLALNDIKQTQSLIRNLSHHFGKQGIWQRFKSDWLAIEVEIRPFKVLAKQMLSEAMPQILQAAQMQQAFVESKLALFETADGALKDWANELRIRKARLKEQRAYLETIQSQADALHLVPHRVLLSQGNLALNESMEWQIQACNDLVEACPSILKGFEFESFEIQDNSEQRRLLAYWKSALEASVHALEITSGQPYLVSKGEWLLPGFVVRHPEYLRLLLGLGFDEPQMLEKIGGQDPSLFLSTDVRRLALVYELGHRHIHPAPFASPLQAVSLYLGMSAQLRPMRFAN